MPEEIKWMSFYGRWLLTITYSSQVKQHCNEAVIIHLQFKCIQRPDDESFLEQDQSSIKKLVKRVLPRANLLEVPHPVIIEYDWELTGEDEEQIFKLQKLFIMIPRRHVQN